MFVRRSLRAIGLALTVTLAVSACQPTSSQSGTLDAAAVKAPSEGPVCDGVAVKPSQSLQRAVDAHGVGTTFCLGVGTYPGQVVKPSKR
jgi:hypothetical protein